jgi:DNA-binding MarR family transcriptional regulator
MADKLVQLGLVARAEAEHDRRVKQLSLTDKGQQLLKVSGEARMGWLRVLAEAVPPARRAEIAALMREMVQIAQSLEEPSLADERP